MTSGKASRAKGVSGERESADIFRAHGFEVVRLQNNVTDAGDYWATLDRSYGPNGAFVGVDRAELVIDSKRRERVRLIEWSRQVEALTGRERQTDGWEDAIPAVAYRPNHEPWRISLRLEDFARLLGNGNE